MHDNYVISKTNSRFIFTKLFSNKTIQFNTHPIISDNKWNATWFTCRATKFTADHNRQAYG